MLETEETKESLDGFCGLQFSESVAFLIIDDESLVLSQLSRILQHAFPKSKIEVAANGIDGIHLARTSRTDVVILDVSMPEMDGFEICRHLKENPATSHLPVLMISGVKKDSASKELAFESGADDYLLKPFSTDDLVFHLKVLLRAKRAEDLLCRQKEQVEDELRHRTQQLYESEKMHRELVEALPDAIFEADVDLNLRYMNPAGLAMLGYTARDLANGLSLKQIVVLSARQADAHIRRVLEGHPSAPYEYMIIKSDGERCVVRISLAPILDNRKVRGLRGIMIDISDFKQLQSELLESRESYHALFENIFDAFCLCEVLADDRGQVSDFRFLKVNSAFEAMTGKNTSELLDHGLRDVMPGIEPFWLDALSQVAVTGKTVRVEKYMGELGRYIQLSAFRPRPGLLAMILQDISDRKIAAEQELELQEKKAHATHLEAVAALAGNAAHELNNILGPILCYPDMIMAELPPDSAAREDLDTIKNSARRAIEVIEDLSTFGHSGIVEKHRIDLNRMIETYMRSHDVEEVRSKCPDLDFALELDPDIPAALFNETHVRRILETMLYRSYESGRSDARIKISTRPAVFSHPYNVYMRTIAPGTYVLLEIHDSGLMLDESRIRNLFELPEKRANRRVPHKRIGLALAYSALKHHGGYVDVREHQTGGMVFSFYLPPDESDQAPDIGEIRAGQGETIMVVDDVLAQRQMASKILTAMGYKVVTAEDGQSALEILRACKVNEDNGGFPALVILDMIMPEIDGLETFKRIQAINPRQPCLIVSGFARSERVQEAERIGIRGFVRKPYTPERLARAISNALNA